MKSILEGGLLPSVIKYIKNGSKSHKKYELAGENYDPIFADSPSCVGMKMWHEIFLIPQDS